MEIKLIDIQDINALPEEIFNLEQGVANAKEILSKLEEDGVLLVGDFEDDLWAFESHLAIGTVNNFDFSELDRFAFSKALPSEFKIIVKAWISELLNLYYPNVVRTMYSVLLMALNWTKGFLDSKLETLLKGISGVGQAGYQQHYFNALFNFFSYSELPVADVYTPRMVEEYRKIVRNQKNTRKLPPSSEVIIFSHHLDMYMEEILSYGGDQYLKEKVLYYPVFLWWRLTTIIPLRASEFSNIARDALDIKENSFYIKLPRFKKDFDSRSNNIVTEIEITEEIYNHFNSYLELTEQFGRTETMCSYRSLLALDGGSRLIKNDYSYFHAGILGTLIHRFYEEILSDKYKISINKENRLTPNLTRHIAFCSLLMQGISPVEIARLGGHKTIVSQYHYSFHVEYWIDSEVFNLMNKHKQSTTFIQNPVTYVPDDIKLVAYKPIPIGGSNEEFSKVEIGYCTDKFQRCETEECFFGCSHWRITPQEIIEKEEMIQEKLTEKRKEIRELQAFIENLHKQILSDELVRRDPQTYLRLKATASEVEECIHDLSRLQLLY